MNWYLELMFQRINVCVEEVNQFRPTLAFVLFDCFVFTMRESMCEKEIPIARAWAEVLDVIADPVLIWQFHFSVMWCPFTTVILALQCHSHQWSTFSQLSRDANLTSRYFRRLFMPLAVENWCHFTPQFHETFIMHCIYLLC